MRYQTTVAAPWQSLLRRLSGALNGRGLSVRRTFDLQVARRSLNDVRPVPCPYHGPSRCTCQYLVLQVRRGAEGAAALIVHGHDSVTRIAVLTETGRGADKDVAAEVRKALVMALIPAGPAQDASDMVEAWAGAHHAGAVNPAPRGGAEHE